VLPVSVVFIGFIESIEFRWVPLCSVGFHCVLLSFVGFHCVLLSSVEFC
jgi:hypothetical protein